MPDNIYEVVSQAARYWFLFLMALIAWRSFCWLRRDRRQRKKRLKRLPDAGYVGELVVMKGSGELPAGLALPVGFEGMLGSLRGNDVCVPAKGVAKKHLWFEFDEEDGLRMEPFRQHQVEVDGQLFVGRHHPAEMTHGSQITIGEAVLKLRLFAGYEYAGIRHKPFHEQTVEPSELQAVETAVIQPQPLAQPSVGGVTFTAEQVAVLQQMQWMAAMQAMRAAQAQPPEKTNVLTTEKGDFVPPPKMGSRGEILLAEPEPDDPEETENAAEPEQAAPEPPRASRLNHLSPLPPLAAEAASDALRRTDARGPAEEVALPVETRPDADEYVDQDARFYPPVEDDETAEPESAQDQPLAYARYPDEQPSVPLQHIRFHMDMDEPGGDTSDEQETAADAPDGAPKSFYVEPDEAEKAKRLLWDKYLKGGRRK